MNKYFYIICTFLLISCGSLKNKLAGSHMQDFDKSNNTLEVPPHFKLEDIPQ